MKNPFGHKPFELPPLIERGYKQLSDRFNLPKKPVDITRLENRVAELESHSKRLEIALKATLTVSLMLAASAGVDPAQLEQLLDELEA